MRHGTADLIDDTFVIKGFLDEDVSLAHVRVPTGQTLKFDLGKMTSLNSVGMRAFSKAIRAHGAGEIEIHRAPVCFIEAVNAVPSLIGGTQFGKRIKSFYVPYVTRSSMRTINILVSTDMIRTTTLGGEVPPAPCPETGQPMQPTVAVEDYLEFLLSYLPAFAGIAG